MTTSFGGPGGGDGDLRRIAPLQAGLLGRIQRLLESRWFQRAITAVIVLNAITLGLETSASVMERAGGSMGHHFVQTLIYGLFHWKPIEERLASGEESAGG